MNKIIIILGLIILINLPLIYAINDTTTLTEDLGNSIGSIGTGLGRFNLFSTEKNPGNGICEQGEGLILHREDCKFSMFTDAINEKRYKEAFMIGWVGRYILLIGAGIYFYKRYEYEIRERFK